MKSSRRQRRYRARFLTHTRTLNPHLARVRDLLEQHREPATFSSWEILFHGLCLKSAQETSASSDAITDAYLAARRVIRLTPGYRDPLLQDYSPED